MFRWTAIALSLLIMTSLGVQAEVYSLREPTVHDFQSESWHRVQLEEWINYKVIDMGRRMLPADNFHVEARIDLAPMPPKVQDFVPRTIDIDKFGLKIDVLRNNPKSAELPRDFFRRINKIDVNFSVAGNVTDEQMASLRDLPFKVITFARPQQISVNMD